MEIIIPTQQVHTELVNLEAKQFVFAEEIEGTQHSLKVIEVPYRNGETYRGIGEFSPEAQKAVDEFLNQ